MIDKLRILSLKIKIDILLLTPYNKIPVSYTHLLVSTKFQDVFSDVHNVDLSMYDVSKQLSI